MTVPDSRVASILAELRAMGSEKNRAGMARYGINVDSAFGVSIYELRTIAKRLGQDSNRNRRARGLSGAETAPSAPPDDRFAEGVLSSISALDACNCAASIQKRKTPIGIDRSGFCEPVGQACLPDFLA
jgi:hypothetical protein